jgi:hypothetical protein
MVHDPWIPAGDPTLRLFSSQELWLLFEWSPQLPVGARHFIFRQSLALAYPATMGYSDPGLRRTLKAALFSPVGESEGNLDLI